jgi:hypothetical protein
VRDRQREQGCPGGLDRVAGDQIRDRRLVERVPREHGALGVVRDRAAEQLVVNRGVDNDHDQQVHRERERIGSQAETVGADAALFARCRHAAGERPSGVVDRRGLAAAILVLAEQFLGVLAEHSPPQVEVVGLVPDGLA